MATVFFEDVLALRSGEPGAGGPAELKTLASNSGFVGNLKSRTFQPALDFNTPTELTSWLPTARVARAGQALVTEKPFDP